MRLSFEIKCTFQNYLKVFHFFSKRHFCLSHALSCNKFSYFYSNNQVSVYKGISNSSIFIVGLKRFYFLIYNVNDKQSSAYYLPKWYMSGWLEYSSKGRFKLARKNGGTCISSNIHLICNYVLLWKICNLIKNLSFHYLLTSRKLMR